MISKTAKRFGFAMRTIACSIVLCFTWTSVATSAPITPSSIQPVTEIKIPSLADQIQIPEHLGSVQKKFVPQDNPGAPVVVHLQDAHGNLDAQMNIKRILETLTQEHGFKVFFLEGASSRLDPTVLNLTKDADTNQKIAEHLTGRGVLSGAELFQFEHQKKKEIQGYGVEDLKLYRENFEDFQQALRKSDAAVARVQKSKRILVKKASRIFSPKLYKFFKAVSNAANVFDEILILNPAAKSELNLDLSKARPQIEWPQLVRFVKLKNLEGKIDFEKVEAEKIALMNWLKAAKGDRLGNLSPFVSCFDELLSGKPVWKTWSETPREFLERFYETASPLGFNFKAYPELCKQFATIILSSELDPQTLAKEDARLRGLLLKKMARNDAEKKLIRRYAKLELLEKLFKLELTREEYQKIKAMEHPSTGSPEHQKAENTEHRSTRTPEHQKNIQVPGALVHWCADAIRFYDRAIQRDQAIFDRLIEQMKSHKLDRAVLVTGGFHSEGIESRLESKGLSYIEVMPHISELDSGKRYHDVMLFKSGVADASQIPLERAMQRLEFRPGYAAFLRSETRLALDTVGAARFETRANELEVGRSMLEAVPSNFQPQTSNPVASRLEIRAQTRQESRRLVDESRFEQPESFFNRIFSHGPILAAVMIFGIVTLGMIILDDIDRTKNQGRLNAWRSEISKMIDGRRADVVSATTELSVGDRLLRMPHGIILDRVNGIILDRVNYEIVEVLRDETGKVTGYEIQDLDSAGHLIMGSQTAVTLESIQDDLKLSRQETRLKNRRVSKSGAAKRSEGRKQIFKGTVQEAIRFLKQRHQKISAKLDRDSAKFINIGSDIEYNNDLVWVLSLLKDKPPKNKVEIVINFPSVTLHYKAHIGGPEGLLKFINSNRTLRRLAHRDVRLLTAEKIEREKPGISLETIKRYLTRLQQVGKLELHLIDWGTKRYQYPPEPSYWSDRQLPVNLEWPGEWGEDNWRYEIRVQTRQETRGEFQALAGDVVAGITEKLSLTGGMEWAGYLTTAGVLKLFQWGGEKWTVSKEFTNVSDWNWTESGGRVVVVALDFVGGKVQFIGDNGGGVWQATDVFEGVKDWSWTESGGRVVVGLDFGGGKVQFIGDNGGGARQAKESSNVKFVFYDGTGWKTQEEVRELTEPEQNALFDAVTRAKAELEIEWKSVSPQADPAESEKKLISALNGFYGALKPIENPGDVTLKTLSKIVKAWKEFRFGMAAVLNSKNSFREALNSLRTLVEKTLVNRQETRAMPEEVLMRANEVLWNGVELIYHVLMPNPSYDYENYGDKKFFDVILQITLNEKNDAPPQFLGFVGHPNFSQGQAVAQFGVPLSALQNSSTLASVISEVLSRHQVQGLFSPESFRIQYAQTTAEVAVLQYNLRIVNEWLANRGPVDIEYFDTSSEEIHTDNLLAYFVFDPKAEEDSVRMNYVSPFNFDCRLVLSSSVLLDLSTSEMFLSRIHGLFKKWFEEAVLERGRRSQGHLDGVKNEVMAEEWDSLVSKLKTIRSEARQRHKKSGDAGKAAAFFRPSKEYPTLRKQNPREELRVFDPKDSTVLVVAEEAAKQVLPKKHASRLEHRLKTATVLGLTPANPEALQSEAAFIHQIMTDSAFREQLGLAAVNEDTALGTGTVVLSAATMLEQPAIFKAVLQLLRDTTSSTSKLSYVFAGPGAAELQKIFTGKSSGLSEVDRFGLKNQLKFEESSTFETAVQSVKADSRVISGRESDVSAIVHQYLSAIESDAGFFDPKLTIEQNAAAYFFRAQLLARLARELEGKFGATAKLPIMAEEISSFVAKFFLQNLGVSVSPKNGRLDLSLSSVYAQLELFRQTAEQIAHAA